MRVSIHVPRLTKAIDGFYGLRCSLLGLGFPNTNTIQVVTHAYVEGNVTVALAPRAPCRGSRVSVPPWASAIWRLNTRPIPEPVGLVVKKGTKRFAVLA